MLQYHAVYLLTWFNDVTPLLYQGTAAGGTTEIVVDGSTGLLHPAGKEGVAPLAKNIVRLASRAEQRASMGKKGYGRVNESEMNMAPFMSFRVILVIE